MRVRPAASPDGYDLVTLSHNELHEAVSAYLRQKTGRGARRLIDINATRVEVAGVRRYNAVHITYELEKT